MNINFTGDAGGFVFACKREGEAKKIMTRDANRIKNTYDCFISFLLDGCLGKKK
jgi:hypothetical protein